MLRKLNNLVFGPSIERIPAATLQRIERLRDHTPDRGALAKKTSWLLFVYDGMKQSYFDHYMLKQGGAEFINKGVTKDCDFTLFKKRYNTSEPFLALASRMQRPAQRNLRYDPVSNPELGRIKGELYEVPVGTLYNLDEALANTVYFQRSRLKIDLPTSLDRWTKDSNQEWVKDEYPRYVYAYTYLVEAVTVNEEPRYAVKTCSYYQPKERPHNLKYQNTKPYFEFTKFDVDGNK